jgi:hypothetical protein
LTLAKSSVGAIRTGNRIEGMLAFGPLHDTTIEKWFVIALVIWAAVKAAPYVRPVKPLREWKWTITDWFDTVFWFSVALAIVFGLDR